MNLALFTGFPLHLEPGNEASFNSEYLKCLQWEASDVDPIISHSSGQPQLSVVGPAFQIPYFFDQAS